MKIEIHCVYSIGKQIFFERATFSRVCGDTSEFIYEQAYLQSEFDLNPCGTSCVIFTTPEQLLGNASPSMLLSDVAGESMRIPW